MTKIKSDNMPANTLSTIALTHVCGGQQAQPDAEKAWQKKAEDCTYSGKCVAFTPEEARAGLGVFAKADSAGLGNHLKLHEALGHKLLGTGPMVPF